MAFKQSMRLFGLFSALFVLTFSWAMAGEDTPRAKSAASVNGVNITEEDINRQMFALEQHWLSTQGSAIRPDMIPVLRKKILDELIDQELLYQESRKQGLEVEEKTVSDEIEELKKRFPNEEAFNDEMRQMNFSEETLKVQMKKNLSVKQLVEKEILANIRVSDEDAKSFYDSHPEHFQQKEKVRASHILIKSEADTDPVSKDERRTKLEAVKKRIENGEDFAALAREFSQCPSAEKGGDLGFFERGNMVKPFEDAAFSMKPGEVSDIVVTPFGFHLIKVTDRTEAGTVSFDESKDRISQHLRQMKFTEEKNAYVGDLKKKSKVETY